MTETTIKELGEVFVMAIAAGALLAVFNAYILPIL